MIGFRSVHSSGSKGQPAIRFLMLMPGRSGSSFLTEKLNDHPNVFAGREPFAFHAKDRTVKKYLRRFYRQGFPQGITAAGFITKLRSIGKPIMSDVDAPRHDVIVNFSEVHAFLRGTEFEPQFLESMASFSNVA